MEDPRPQVATEVIRELDQRYTDGIGFTLLWNSKSNRARRVTQSRGRYTSGSRSPISLRSTVTTVATRHRRLRWQPLGSVPGRLH